MTNALFILDMQTDLLAANGRFPVAQEQVAGAINKTNQAIKEAAACSIPVVYINNGFWPWDPGNLFRGRCCIRNQIGAELDPRVYVLSGAPEFIKSRASAFSSPEFAQWVAQQRLESAAIAGVYADACVRATAIAAVQRGIQVTVLADAVAASKQRTRDAGLEKMIKAGAEVMPLLNWLAGLHPNYQETNK